MRSYAAAFVSHIAARTRLPLDYSVRSLRVVDFLIDGLHKGGADREQVRDTCERPQGRPALRGQRIRLR
ncbi:hypothetical protein ABZY09_19485 [Streptomyces sp. NPDC002928]|uniref:hypothetical protein n=1 Tax=Streptomyces sp. NPDC002928 TaxID=3154440 RepID=UPI0033BBF42B